MRKGRFEDQRGTEICFEIPEFLRLPDNRYVRILGSVTFFNVAFYFQRRGPGRGCGVMEPYSPAGPVSPGIVPLSYAGPASHTELCGPGLTHADL